ncbi:hypothetical protein Ocin01_07796 [Orchesella cincta]|uniref:Uncharacterized protein n=1 Tax=Orchesella cincta TaxID=48709 RepID=A0A1D2N1G8_ORCCI|nr:hypothetical protein Ocin01_07796 [Orchesella cincta]
MKWQSDGALVPGPETCSDEQLKKCADSAEPLYKDPELVVPDNSKSVNKVCSLWNELTSCIKSYTSRCMTRQQKSEFDRAFKDPIVSMSTLCQDQDYRKEYLHHAPCVKKISTQGTYCGNQYRYLIDLVSGGSANIKQICW